MKRISVIALIMIAHCGRIDFEVQPSTGRCDDALFNGKETDVDCGGPECPACGPEKKCIGPDDCSSHVCSASICQAPSCDDEALNQDESDVDCGGSCNSCEDSKRCQNDDDCLSNVCNNEHCVPIGCSDEQKNQDESDVDCGGVCGASCKDGQTCVTEADCVSNFCNASNQCATASCTDGELNQDETDVDCGGAFCSACDAGEICTDDDDCVTVFCNDSNLCATPSCSDGELNQDETDIDCGGICGASCGNGLMCEDAADCISGYCNPEDICSTASCSDGFQNQNETDVDCGGICGASCLDGQTCSINGDCVGNSCSGFVCVTVSCSNAIQDGNETDVDCGGVTCPACPDLAGCDDDSDCESGVCTGNICQTPTCNDGVQNQDETDVDCGGVSCEDCGGDEGCDDDSDCVSGSCTNGECDPILTIDVSELDGSNGFAVNRDPAGNQAATRRLGTSVACGDVNGDGFGDVTLGAGGDDPPGGVNAGRAYLLFGTTTFSAVQESTAAENVIINGSADDARAGDAVSHLGDVDNDGFGDVLISERLSRETYLLFGSSSWPSNIDVASYGSYGAVKYHYPAQSDYMAARSASPAGDVNGDGHRDMVFGASNYGDDIGIAFAVYGTANLTDMNLTDVDGSNGFALTNFGQNNVGGFAVGTAGDVNNDGFDDVLVTAPGTSNGQDFAGPGAVYLVFGGSSLPANIDRTTLNGSNGVRFVGAAISDGAGWSVSFAAGDVNNDGYDDILIGSPYANVSAADAGKVYLVYGKSGGWPAIFDLASMTASDGVVFQGNANYRRLGSSVQLANDVNGDGMVDILLGAETRTTSAGFIYVIFGRPSYPATFNVSSLNGANGFSFTGAHIGNVVDSCDINNDGYSDIVTANSHYNNYAGRGYVLFGFRQ